MVEARGRTRRGLLLADLDAGLLHLYGLDRVEAEHVLDSFTVVRKYEERDYGEYRTKRLVLEAYERMARNCLSMRQQLSRQRWIAAVEQLLARAGLLPEPAPVASCPEPEAEAVRI